MQDEMIDHIGFSVSEYEHFKAFYAKALAPLGYVLTSGVAEKSIIGAPMDDSALLIHEPRSGQEPHCGGSWLRAQPSVPISTQSLGKSRFAETIDKQVHESRIANRDPRA
jgi:hypothetical protein